MIVKSIAHGEKVLRAWENIPWLAQDTETKPKVQFKEEPKSTLIRFRHRVFIFSACYRGEAYSFPTNVIDPSYPTITEWSELWDWFLNDLNPKMESVFHNFNYDNHALREMGWKPFRNVWDTMIGCWMANANIDKSLKARAPLYGRHVMDTKMVDFDDLTALANYAEGDVICTDEFYQMQMFGVVRRPPMLRWMQANGKYTVPVKNEVGELELVIENEKLTEFDRLFLRKQELPVLRSTIEAEDNGVPFNTSRLKVIRAKMDEDLEKVTKRIYRAAGENFNINSNPKKVEVLTGLGVKITARTKKGNKPSVNVDSMSGLIGQHPIVKDFMEYSKIDKLRGTYIGDDEEGGLEYYFNSDTGCIHPGLNTVGAVTGRFSSSNPNCQNIPARNDRYGIKTCFEAPKGEQLICMDFSQIELRVMALLSKDPLMTKVLNDPNGDIHTETANKMHVPRDPVAKQCNFLIQFGGGGGVLSQRLCLEGQPTTKEQGDQLIVDWDNTYRFVKPFRESQFKFHEQNGFIYLLTGRRRVINNILSTNRYKRHMAETQLANNLIQGSAQDLMKALIIRMSPNRPNMDKYLGNFVNLPREHALILKDYAAKVEKYRRVFRLANMKFRLQVHDEILNTAQASAALECGSYISEMMTWRHFFPPITDMSVAIRGDGGVGPTWALAKKPKDPAFKIHAPVKLAQ